MNYLSDMRLLNIFTTVFKQRSISGASRILNTSQPTITRSIHNLEIELGIELFIRSSEGLIPTDFSYKLYKRALSIIDEVDSIFLDAEFLPSSSRTLLNIGVGHGCCYTVNKQFTEYRKIHEDIVFNEKIASARNLLSEIEHGFLEIIIGSEDTLKMAEWLTINRYVKHDLFMVARKDHPVFKESKDNQYKMIKQYPYITYHLLEDSHGTKLPNAPVFRINNHLILLEQVKNSDSYMLINQELIHFIDVFNLAIIGGRKRESINFAVAYNDKTISTEGKELVDFMLSNI
ncbi:MAG: LysR family transcriptional regulator [Spirochaetaceae bacterium]